MFRENLRRQWRVMWPRGLAVPFFILACRGPRQLRPIPLHPRRLRVRGRASRTGEGVGIDGLQSLQLVALLLAVICHRGPRRCPWIAQAPRRRAARGPRPRRDSTQRPAGASAESPAGRPGAQSQAGPAGATASRRLRLLPSSAFDSFGLASGALRGRRPHARLGLARRLKAPGLAFVTDT